MAALPSLDHQDALFDTDGSYLRAAERIDHWAAWAAELADGGIDYAAIAEELLVTEDAVRLLLARRTEHPLVRGLTVKQPWAWAITAGKNIENRSWKVPQKYIGATLLVHAGLKPVRDAFQDERILALPAMPPVLAAGAVLAIARLAGCHREEDGCCAPWGDTGAFHWQLEDVRPLPQPVKYTGALSLWKPSTPLLHEVLR